MYVCLCMGVTGKTIEDAIDAGASTTKQVAEMCGAGTVCGRCRNSIRAIIKTRQVAVPPHQKLAGLRRRFVR